MWALIQFYWGICTFKIGPERTPAYPAFMVMITAAFFLFNVFIRVWIIDTSLAQAVVGTTLVTGVLVGMVWALLRFKQLTARLNATVGALLGQDLFLGVLTLPLQISIVSDEPWGMSLMMILMVYCWDLAIKGAILRRALNVGPLLGMCTALMMLLLAVYAETTWVISHSDERPATVQQNLEPAEVHKHRGSD